MINRGGDFGKVRCQQDAVPGGAELPLYGGIPGQDSNKGYLVRGLSVAELQSLFQFRGILEKASAELGESSTRERGFGSSGGGGT